MEFASLPVDDWIQKNEISFDYIRKMGMSAQSFYR